MSEKKNNKPEAGKDPEIQVTPAPAADPETVAAKIIAEAEERAAKIVADAEAEAKAKAETAAKIEDKDAPAPVLKDNSMDELVDYTAPLLPGVKKRDVIVSVNGEILRIQRGVPVKIKRKHYEALQNAAKQEFAAYESRQQIQKQGEKPLASM